MPCGMCGSNDTVITTEDREFLIGTAVPGRERYALVFTGPDTFTRCTNCAEEFYTDSQAEERSRRIDAAYRKDRERLIDRVQNLETDIMYLEAELGRHGEP